MLPRRSSHRRGLFRAAPPGPVAPLTVCQPLPARLRRSALDTLRRNPVGPLHPTGFRLPPAGWPRRRVTGMPTALSWNDARSPRPRGALLAGGGAGDGRAQCWTLTREWRHGIHSQLGRQDRSRRHLCCERRERRFPPGAMEVVAQKASAEGECQRECAVLQRWWRRQRSEDRCYFHADECWKCKDDNNEHRNARFQNRWSWFLTKSTSTYIVNPAIPASPLSYVLNVAAQFRSMARPTPEREGLSHKPRLRGCSSSHPAPQEPSLGPDHSHR